LTRIGIISDTHGFLDPAVFKYFKNCNEIWHAGDFGSIKLADELAAGSNVTIRGVYGNIDDKLVRNKFPEQLIFTCEQVKVMIRHIGGYPPKYNPAAKKELFTHKPQLFITGHSHILKIMFDDKLRCLCINPGAAGKQGWQKIRTIVRLTVDGRDMKDCEVIELDKT
jgi:putative phosphoesterase